MPLPSGDLYIGEIVNEGWRDSQELATDAVEKANAFLDKILALIPGEDLLIPDVNANIQIPDVSISDLNIPAAPVLGDLAFRSPQEPGDIALNSISPIVVPDAPVFSATAPTLNIPNKPSALSATPPGTAPVLTDVAIPADPNVVLPDVPTLRDLNLPAEPSIVFPTFDVVFPDDDLLAPPGQTLDFVETLYTSTLLDCLKQKLEDDIKNGNSGLPVAIERAIYDRGRSREQQQSLRNRHEAFSGFAARGFALPPGALAKRLREAEQDMVNKESDLSRQTLIDQAQRAYQHMQFALTSAIQCEGQMIQYTGEVAGRALQAQTAVLQAGISIFSAQVQRFNAQVQAAQAEVTAFELRVRAELNKIEVFKAQLDGQRLVGELNKQDVEIYQTRVQAVLSGVEIFRAQVEAAKVAVDVQRSRIQAFQAEVEAYRSLVEAKTSEFDAFKTEVEAEVAQVTAFREQATAFSAEVDGYAALVRALSAQKETDIQVNRALIDQFQARVAAFQAKLQAEGARVQAEATAFTAGTTAFNAQVGAETSRVNAEVAVAEAQTRVAETEGNLFIKQAEINIQKARNAVDATLNAIAAGAGVAQQLAASALSMVNLSSALSDNYQTSVSTATQTSTSTSTTTNIDATA